MTAFAAGLFGPAVLQQRPPVWQVVAVKTIVLEVVATTVGLVEVRIEVDVCVIVGTVVTSIVQYAVLVVVV
jgi:hypothetical protein